VSVSAVTRVNSKIQRLAAAYASSPGGSMPCSSGTQCGMLRPCADAAQLVKLKVTAAAALSTALGFVLAGAEIGAAFLFAVSGTFLMACASAAINEIQDSKVDKLMERTRGRPIPARRMTCREAAGISLVLALAGTGLLARLDSAVPLCLGILTMAWYNLFYTYLKRISAFAVLPGALTGALPPLIGWSAAGGDLADPRALAIAAFFFFWQIPHFWILLLLFSGDYARAGLPSLESVFSARQIKRLTFVWLVGAAASGLALPLTGAANSDWFTPVYLCLASLLLACSARGLWGKTNYRQVFVCINLFMLATMVVLFVQSV
jgi:heme o synthase